MASTKIKNQLRVSIAIFVVVLAIIAVSVLVTEQQTAQLQTRHIIALDIENRANNLAYISNNYFLYQESSQLELWQSEYSSLTNDITKLNPSTPEQQALLKNVKGDAQRIDNVWAEVVAFLENIPQNVSVRSSPAFQTGLSRMAVQNQALAFETQQLSQSFRSQIDQLNKTNIILIFAFLGLFGAYFVTNYLITYRNTLNSISELQEGMSVIGSGNLDHSLKADKKDEIGEISKSVNNMINNLKAVTASKADLEKENIERKKIEEALSRSEEKYRLLVESPNSIVMTVDKNLNITYMNKFGLDFFGYTAEELLGKNVVGTTIPIKDDEGRNLSEMANDLRKNPERYKTNVHKNMLKNGKLVWVSWTNRARYDKNGDLLEILAIGNDISILKDAEDKLRASKVWEATSYYTRNLIEASLDPLVTISAEGKITDANKATELATGCCREELIGSDFSSYFTEPKKAAAGYKQAFTEGFVLDYPLAIKNKSGAIFDVLYNASVYVDLNGIVQGVFAAARDITDRKKLEKQVQDSERLAAIGATAGMVGHDIRNPLQAIMGDVYLVESELTSLPDSEEKKNSLESLTEIEENINYINKIVADLQDFARPLNPHTQESDIKAIVEETLTKNGVPKNIKVEVKVKGEAQNVTADPDYLKRIVGNLVLNAVQAMPQGGKLAIKTHKDKQTGDVVLTVEDTGVGIPNDVKNKLFTPMFTTKSKGQGFGLAVVKRMANALGGTVSFESEHGKGSKFMVRLPHRKKEIHGKIDIK